MQSMKRMLPQLTGQVAPPPPPQRVPVEPPQELKFSLDLIASLRRHWFVSAVLMVAILLAGVLPLRKIARPVFAAHSEIYLSPRFPKVLSADSEKDLPYDSYVDDQAQTVTRRDIIAAAIEKMPVEIRHRTGPALPYEIQVLQNSLKVQRIRSSYLISIELKDRSPVGLAETVNFVTDTYIEKSKSEEFYGLDKRLSILEGEKNRLRDAIDSRLNEQADLMKQLGVATISSVQGVGNPYDSTAGQLRQEVIAARAQREAAEAQLTAVSRVGSGNSSPIADSAVDDAISTDPALSANRTALSARRTALMSEMSGLTADHPIYKRDQNELNMVDASLADLHFKAAQRVQDRLKEEVNRTRMIEMQHDRELAQTTHSATAAAPKFQRAIELGPEIEDLQKASAAVDDRLRELSLESNSPGSIHVSSLAVTPLEPEKGKFIPALIALILASLIAGLVSPVAIDMIDGRIFTANDVERTLGFYPIATLLNEEEFSSTITNEYYFRLAASIEHAVRQSSVRSFLFTAPTNQCGTSTVVQEVSERLGQLGLKTKIIIAGPDGIQAVHPEVPKKLSDEEITLPVPAEGTASLALNPTIDQCDVVLIDASPLPITAYTEYLARMTDVTVIVLSSGNSTKAELKRFAKLLERLEVAGVAAVLNRITRDRADKALRRELRHYEQRSKRDAKKRSNTSIFRLTED